MKPFRPARPSHGRFILGALRAAFLAAALTALTANPADPQPGVVAVRWQIVESGSSSPLPSRIHLRDSHDKPVRPPGFPFWRDHFVGNGTLDLQLAPGTYRYEIERGPQYEKVSGELRIAAGQPISQTNELRRLTRIESEGWWSGDLHVHRPLADIELLMRAEDLHFAPVITWWNGRGPWATNPVPAQTVVSFDTNRWYAKLGGEDERGGGALLYFGLGQPLAIEGLGREYPSATRFLREAREHAGAWVDLEKPFWWDTPIWLANGPPDSVGICHNHLHRDGMMDNEAWGRPRDRSEYPPAWGNGLYTQDLYYRILNAGFRIPPSAGSASGVLPNPVGYNRVWVHLDGAPTWDTWWEGLRAGRAFVGNGPLLRVRANGQLPGHVFQTNGPLPVLLEAKIDSRDPVRAVELVRNGRVDRISPTTLVSIHESGWFLVRVLTEVTNTFRFASTAPWYVEIGNDPRPVRREAASFFRDWVAQRETQIAAAVTNPTERDAALEPVRAATTFWNAQVSKSVTTVPVTVEVADDPGGTLLPARVYVRGDDGRWFFPETTSAQGSAIRYERRNWFEPADFEYHTTVSAHPFQLELPPGGYTIAVERGKEYRPVERRFAVAADPVRLRIPVRRWVNLAARGWYSGDTHVHRTVAELPNVMAAEDLNVALPMTSWVTKAFSPPTQGDKNTDGGGGGELIKVDDTHVIWPRNTEYEIFSVNGKSHTLGAIFVLNHHSPLELGVPPVRPAMERPRREGALLDLDKHNWPWSLALVALLDVDLFELANNHHWRTTFGITNWATPAPAWMGLSHTGHGDERDWTSFTFQSYYALLDCGFRMRPSAGSANGVHPVPLGFGRVYVHLPDGFDFAAWMKGLNAGRSFVTTGPMLLTQTHSNRISGVVLSEEPVPEVEVVVNGEVAHRVKLEPATNAEGAWQASFHQPLAVEGTHWVAARCFEPRAMGRQRFAHSAPVWFDDAARPLHPRRREIEYLLEHVRAEIARSTGVVPAAAIQEYEVVAKRLETIAATARP